MILLDVRNEPMSSIGDPTEAKRNDDYICSICGQTFTKRVDTKV